jgi:hypothetical protein
MLNPGQIHQARSAPLPLAASRATLRRGALVIVSRAGFPEVAVRRLIAPTQCPTHCLNSDVSSTGGRIARAIGRLFYRPEADWASSGRRTQPSPSAETVIEFGGLGCDHTA